MDVIVRIDVIDGMDMDREQLAAFDRIAREGSFTRAAIYLGIGQPAISARIQALEEQVGGILFTRGRRRSGSTGGSDWDRSRRWRAAWWVPP